VQYSLKDSSARYKVDWFISFWRGSA